MAYVENIVNSNLPGIYIILNLTNGRCYIGSSGCIRHRLGQHKSMLKKNVHHCKPLQNAWNKYGETSFEFIPLENCEKDQTFVREQIYFDSFRGLYNVSYLATSNAGVPRKPSNIKNYPAFKDSNGVVYPPGQNLKAFCRKHNLMYKNMNQVARKEKCSHKGWTLVDEKVPKIPKRICRQYPSITGPDGTVYPPGEHIIRFAKELGMDPKTLVNIIDQTAKNTKGWRLT